MWLYWGSVDRLHADHCADPVAVALHPFEIELDPMVFARTFVPPDPRIFSQRRHNQVQLSVAVQVAGRPSAMPELQVRSSWCKLAYC